MKTHRAFEAFMIAATIGAGLEVPSWAATDCFSTHATDSAPGLEICISAHGNLVQFKTGSGLEHIRGAQPKEGYLLCSDPGPTVHGFDTGPVEQGFGPPTIVQPGGPNTSPLTITRKTTDGIFRLKQVFSWEPTELELSLKMVISNRSGSPRDHVRIVRYFDADMNGSAANDNFWSTSLTVLALDSQNPFAGLMLSAVTLGAFTAAAPVDFSSWDFTDCTPLSVVTDGPSDKVGFAVWDLGAIGPGKDKSLKLLYRAF